MSGDARWTITRAGEALDGRPFEVLGQRIVPKLATADLAVLEVPMAPGQFLPVHVHPDRDETITVTAGRLRLKLAGSWQAAAAGDLVHIPRGMAHGLFNDGDEDAVVLVFTTPAGRTMEMLHRLEGVTDSAAVMAAMESCGMVLLGGAADE